MFLNLFSIVYLYYHLFFSVSALPLPSSSSHQIYLRCWTSRTNRWPHSNLNGSFQMPNRAHPGRDTILTCLIDYIGFLSSFWLIFDRFRFCFGEWFWRWKAFMLMSRWTLTIGCCWVWCGKWVLSSCNWGSCFLCSAGRSSIHWMENSYLTFRQLFINSTYIFYLYI